MTLIEFYDSTAIHNVLSALLLAPARLILVGADEEDLRKDAGRISRLLKARGMETDIETFCLSDKTYDGIYKAVEKIVMKHSDCVMELVGGDALIMTVLGAISEKYGIPMHTADPTTMSISPFTKKEVYPPISPVSLSVNELISLYGGLITQSTAPPISNNPFWQDVLSVWAVCRKNSGDFNSAVSAFHSLCPPESIHPYLSVQKLTGSLSPQKAEKVLALLEGLNENGAILAFKKTKKDISFRYKSRAVQEALHKEGSVLEFYTYFAALSDFGQGSAFSDGKIGVEIEWDDAKDNLKNEIDVMLMDGITPIFISCKNGYVGTEELYKLSVVADRFGGPYAKKAIVMTKQKADISFLARARELGISVISDVQEMPLAGFSKYLKRTLKNKT